MMERFDHPKRLEKLGSHTPKRTLSLKSHLD